MKLQFWKRGRLLSIRASTITFPQMINVPSFSVTLAEDCCIVRVNHILYVCRNCFVVYRCFISAV